MTIMQEIAVRQQISAAGFKIAASQLRGMNTMNLTYVQRAWDSYTKGSEDVFTDGNYTFVAPRQLTKKRVFDDKTKKVVVR